MLYLWFDFQIFCDYAYNIGFDDTVRMQLEHTEEPVYAFEFMLCDIKNPVEELCKRMYISDM